jgi:hypothetical protein
MSRVQMRRQIRQLSQRGRAEAYARLADWWHRGVASGEEEQEVLRQFVALTDWEHAEGTPLAGILRRLPAKMSEALWAVLRQLVDGSKAECDRTKGGDRAPLLGQGDASLVRPIEPLFDNQSGGTRPGSGP